MLWGLNIALYLPFPHSKLGSSPGSLGGSKGTRDWSAAWLGPVGRALDRESKSGSGMALLRAGPIVPLLALAGAPVVCSGRSRVLNMMLRNPQNHPWEAASMMPLLSVRLGGVR